MFKLEKQKTKILILLNLNKENLTTKLSAILAPYNIKSTEVLKKVVIELKQLYNNWIGYELDLFLNEDTIIITHMELTIPVVIILNSSNLYNLYIKLPNWGFLFNYYLKYKRDLFYLYCYKSFFIKGIFVNFFFKNLINFYISLRYSFFKNYLLIF